MPCLFFLSRRLKLTDDIRWLVINLAPFYGASIASSTSRSFIFKVSGDTGKDYSDVATEWALANVRRVGLLGWTRITVSLFDSGLEMGKSIPTEDSAASEASRSTEAFVP